MKKNMIIKCQLSKVLQKLLFRGKKIAEFGVFRLYPQADYLGTQLREKRMFKQVTDFFKYFFFIFKQR